MCCLIMRKKKQCNNGIVIANTRKDCISLSNRAGLDKTRVRLLGVVGFEGLLVLVVVDLGFGASVRV